MTSYTAILFLAIFVVMVTSLPTPGDKGGSSTGFGNDDWKTDIRRLPGGGTHVRAEANYQFFGSKDGTVRGDVGGFWDRTYGGPTNGNRDRGVQASVSAKI